MSKNTLLMSATILKDRSVIHTNIDEKLLFPDIKMAQDRFIHPKLGSALFNKMIDLIETTNISGVTNTAYKTLLDDYIIDCQINYVLSELCISLPYQFWNKGVLRKGGDTTENPTMSELVDISNHYRIKAEWYGERLSRYLKQTATATVLLEYLQPGAQVDTIVPEHSSFTMPIYLGPEKYHDDCCCEYPINNP